MGSDPCAAMLAELATVLPFDSFWHASVVYVRNIKLPCFPGLTLSIISGPGQAVCFQQIEFINQSLPLRSKMLKVGTMARCLHPPCVLRALCGRQAASMQPCKLAGTGAEGVGASCPAMSSCHTPLLESTEELLKVNRYDWLVEGTLYLAWIPGSLLTI